MDPLSQGVLGATVPQAITSNRKVMAAGVLGFLSGMAPDLDVLIRSEADPLLFLEYHRQFTHALVFIPVGGLLCTLLLYGLFRKCLALDFRQSYLFCTLGYGTHGLLDACTSYGTQLLWPFSSERFAWNTVSIIDPLFTLPLLVLVLLAMFKKRARFAHIALIWVLIYQGFGVFQQGRAADAGWVLAQQRGHNPLRLEVKPSFANLLLWKVIYEVEDGYYTSAARMGLTVKTFPGQFTKKVNIEKDLPWLDKDSQQAKDIERFRWFSNGYLAIDSENPNRIIDIRYSLVPNEATGLWGINLSPDAGADQYVVFQVNRRATNQRKQAFYNMLFE